MIELKGSFERHIYQAFFDGAYAHRGPVDAEFLLSGEQLGQHLQKRGNAAAMLFRLKRLSEQRRAKLAAQATIDALLKRAAEGRGQPYREVALLLKPSINDPSKVFAISLIPDFPPAAVAQHQGTIYAYVPDQLPTATGVLLHSYRHPRIALSTVLQIADRLAAEGRLGDWLGDVSPT